MPQSETALIVDDHQGLAENLALALRAAGFETRTACDGMKGYASYLCQPSDWVVTDIEMPELDGVEMIRCIRLLNPSVKTIYMTGASDKYWAVLAREAHEFAAQVLRKPFALNRLIERMRDKQVPRIEAATDACSQKTAPRVP